MKKLETFKKDSLVFYEKKKDYIFTDSKNISDFAKVKHSSIQQVVNKNLADFEEFGTVEFSDLISEKSKNSKRGRPERIYFFNEQQAILLLTYLKNTDPVKECKKKLVKEFFKLRDIVDEKKQPDWEQQRISNINIRKLETDSIKMFVEYARQNGSENADRYYISFSRLANSLSNVYNRNCVPIQDLKKLEIIEKIIDNEIPKQIKGKVEYHQAFKNIRKKVIEIISYLN